MRIRIQDPENVHTVPDPGKILLVINFRKPNVTLTFLDFFKVGVGG